MNCRNSIADLEESVDTNWTFTPTANDYDVLQEFSSAYMNVHAYLAIIFCCFGTLGNLCNIVVLLQPKMISTVNVILTAVAACDTGLMVSYLVYLCHFRLTQEPYCRLMTYGWALYTLFHANFSVTVRATSLWLTVVMAVVRREILKSPSPNPSLSDPQLARRVIAATVGCVMLLNLPVYVTHSIRTHHFEAANETALIEELSCPNVLYVVEGSEMAQTDNCLLIKISFWVNGLVNKFLPCVLLTGFLVGLIRFVLDHFRRRQAAGYHVCPAMRPTTPILSAIILVTLVTEMPHAILSVLGGLMPPTYFENIYKNLGDLIDIFSLFNCITTFVLYCSMSQLFRETFMEVILSPCRAIATRRDSCINGMRRPLLDRDRTTRETSFTAVENTALSHSLTLPDRNGFSSYD